MKPEISEFQLGKALESSLRKHPETAPLDLVGFETPCNSLKQPLVPRCLPKFCLVRSLETSDGILEMAMESPSSPID